MRVVRARLTFSLTLYYIVTGGTLLTVGTFLLSGVLFVVGFFALGFSAFVAAAWFCVSKAFSVVSVASDRLTTIRPPKINSSSSRSSRSSVAALGNGLHYSD